jgi:hypothetical protein
VALKTLSNCILLSEFVGECFDPTTKSRILTSHCNHCLSCKFDRQLDHFRFAHYLQPDVQDISKDTPHALDNVTAIFNSFGPGRKLPSCTSLFDAWHIVNISCRRVTINVTIFVNIAHTFGLLQRIWTGLGGRD